MKDDLLKIYESIYGEKNTIEQVERAVDTTLRGSDNTSYSVIESYMQANGYPKNEPAKLQDAQDHIPDELKPAIEAPEELSPAVDSSTSTQKLTKTITDKEKKTMTSQKFSFDELYKTALKENMEGEQPMSFDDPMQDAMGEEDIGSEDSITVTLNRETAQALCDILQGALGQEEGEEGEEGMDLGDSAEDSMEDELEEGTDMSKAPDSKAKVTSKAHMKVPNNEPVTANKYIGNPGTGNDPYKNAKGIKKPVAKNA